MEIEEAARLAEDEGADREDMVTGSRAGDALDDTLLLSLLSPQRSPQLNPNTDDMDRIGPSSVPRGTARKRKLPPLQATVVERRVAKLDLQGRVVVEDEQFVALREAPQVPKALPPLRLNIFKGTGGSAFPAAPCYREIIEEALPAYEEPRLYRQPEREEADSAGQQQRRRAPGVAELCRVKSEAQVAEEQRARQEAREQQRHPHSTKELQEQLARDAPFAGCEPPELPLGCYRPRNLSKLVWSAQHASLLRRELLRKRLMSVSHTPCVVSIWGCGVSGRVITTGANQPRFLLVEAYSIWNSRKYFLALTAAQLKHVFQDRPDLLKPGRKQELLDHMLKCVYFEYTLITPPISRKAVVRALVARRGSSNAAEVSQIMEILADARRVDPDPDEIKEQLEAASRPGTTSAASASHADHSEVSHTLDDLQNRSALASTSPPSSNRSIPESDENGRSTLHSASHSTPSMGMAEDAEQQRMSTTSPPAQSASAGEPTGADTQCSLPKASAATSGADEEELSAVSQEVSDMVEEANEAQAAASKEAKLRVRLQAMSTVLQYSELRFANRRLTLPHCDKPPEDFPCTLFDVVRQYQMLDREGTQQRRLFYNLDMGSAKPMADLSGGEQEVGENASDSQDSTSQLTEAESLAASERSRRRKAKREAARRRMREEAASASAAEEAAIDAVVADQDDAASLGASTLASVESVPPIDGAGEGDGDGDGDGGDIITTTNTNTGTESAGNSDGKDAGANEGDSPAVPPTPPDAAAPVAEGTTEFPETRSGQTTPDSPDRADGACAATESILPGQEADDTEIRPVGGGDGELQQEAGSAADGLVLELIPPMTGTTNVRDDGNVDDGSHIVHSDHTGMLGPGSRGSSRKSRGASERRSEQSNRSGRHSRRKSRSTGTGHDYGAATGEGEGEDEEEDEDEDGDEVDSLSGLRPRLKQKLCIASYELPNAGQVRRRDILRKQQEMLERLRAEREAWLATPPRKRGLVMCASRTFRQTTLVLLCYQMPSRMGNAIVKGYDPSTCEVYGITLSVSFLGELAGVKKKPLAEWSQLEKRLGMAAGIQRLDFQQAVRDEEGHALSFEGRCSMVGRPVKLKSIFSPQYQRLPQMRPRMPGQQNPIVHLSNRTTTPATWNQYALLGEDARGKPVPRRCAFSTNASSTTRVERPPVIGIGCELVPGVCRARPLRDLHHTHRLASGVGRLGKNRVHFAVFADVGALPLEHVTMRMQALESATEPCGVLHRFTTFSLPLGRLEVRRITREFALVDQLFAAATEAVDPALGSHGHGKQELNKQQNEAGAAAPKGEEDKAGISVPETNPSSVPSQGDTAATSGDGSTAAAAADDDDDDDDDDVDGGSGDDADDDAEAAAKEERLDQRSPASSAREAKDAAALVLDAKEAEREWSRIARVVLAYLTWGAADQHWREPYLPVISATIVGGPKPVLDQYHEARKTVPRFRPQQLESPLPLAKEEESVAEEDGASLEAADISELRGEERAEALLKHDLATMEFNVGGDEDDGDADLFSDAGDDDATVASAAGNSEVTNEIEKADSEDEDEEEEEESSDEDESGSESDSESEDEDSDSSSRTKSDDDDDDDRLIEERIADAHDSEVCELPCLQSPLIVPRLSCEIYRKRLRLQSMSALRPDVCLPVSVSHYGLELRVSVFDTVTHQHHLVWPTPELQKSMVLTMEELGQLERDVNITPYMMELVFYDINPLSDRELMEAEASGRSLLDISKSGDVRHGVRFMSELHYHAPPDEHVASADADAYVAEANRREAEAAARAHERGEHHETFSDAATKKTRRDEATINRLRSADSGVWD